MKKNLLLLAAFMFAITIANAQFKVLLVDDDINTYDEWEYVSTALQNSGYAFDTINIDTNAAPSYDTLRYYDMVIWHTANDGLNLNLWDTVSGNPVQYNAALMQYLDSNGIVWVDGLDFMYDQFGTAPDTFHAGDFVYDVMGIEVYAAQSHSDDSLAGFDGLKVAYPASTNSITTMDSIKWKWSSLWYGDAFDITNDATALFEMGPASYDFYGKVNGLYKENLITTSLRIASLGDGSTRVQADIDLLVKEMIVAAEAGTFAPVGINGSTISKADVNIYPNPATNNITITFPSAKNINMKIFDITGKVLNNIKIEANSTSYSLNVSKLNSGIYFCQITVDNATVSRKFSVIK